MNKILFASHGHLASGIQSSLELIVGKRSNVRFIDAYVDEDDDFENQVDAFIDQCDPSDHIVLVSDLLGGSVNNVFLRYCNHPNTTVVSGMCLPLALQLVLENGPLDRSTVDTMVQTSKASIKVCDLITVDEQELFDD